jgi:hypothetical protein
MQEGGFTNQASSLGNNRRQGFGDLPQVRRMRLDLGHISSPEAGSDVPDGLGRGLLVVDDLLRPTL